MKNRHRRLLWTGVVAVLLPLLAGTLSMTKINWIGAPVLLPGMLAASAFFPEGIHSGHAYIFLVLGFVIDCCFTWGILLVVLKLYDIVARRQIVKHDV